jgi:DHA1 family tetracycline resistance protein-like MFS transporter
MIFRRDRTAAMPFIMLTTLIDMVSIGLIIPVLPALVGSFTGSQTDQAFWYGVITFAFGFANFFASPILGALSDAHGRRPVLLLGFCGLALSFLLTALATSLAMLVAIRVLSGAMQANMSVSNAYVADITPPQERTKRFGMLGAMFGIGFILGPVMGGLLGSIDLRLPFFAAGSLALVNLLYGWFVLPESLPPERRGAFSWAKANPVGALALLRSQPQLLGLATANFLAQLAHVVLPSVTVLYAGYRYGWDETAVGLMLAGVGVCSMIVQGGLVRPAVARFGERRALLSGLAFGLAGFVIYGAASTGSVFLIGVPVMALWGLTSPAVQALMTRRVGATEQGRLQGATASLQAIAGLVGPGLFTQTFAASIGPRADLHLPGAPFYVAALLLGASLVVGWRATAANARGS